MNIKFKPELKSTCRRRGERVDPRPGKKGERGIVRAWKKIMGVRDYICCSHIVLSYGKEKKQNREEGKERTM